MKLSLIVSAILAFSATTASAVDLPTPTEYRDAQIITCMASVSEAAVLKNSDLVVGKCLAKADAKTAKWVTKQAEKKAKAIAKAALKAEKAQAKVAAKVAACATDTECQKADGIEI